VGSGGIGLSGDSGEVDGSGAVVPCQFVGDSGSGGGGFGFALNHICDYY
jgi:hypothetical protein